jgi:CRISPR-associated exonuclease Cas4
MEVYNSPYFWKLVWVCIVVVLVGCAFYKSRRIFAKKLPTKQGLFGYDIFYADQKKEQRDSNGLEYGALLYSEKYDIQGKPDYIFKKKYGKALVPVEIKSGFIKEESWPHAGDMMQLAAYFLLIEDVYGIRPRQGRLLYQDYMFIIKNTAAIRKEVKRQIISMRKMLQDGKGEPVCSFAHCRYCVCNGTVCEFCDTRY